MASRPAAPRPFELAVGQDVLDDLAVRLRRTRWPRKLADDEGWRYGMDQDYLRVLVDYWLDGYDWPERQSRLNRWPQYTVDIDGHTVHYLMKEGTGPDPLPLVLTHGWPSSYTEFAGVVEALADPASSGGDPAASFTVVVPSLPGFGFSTTRNGTNVAQTAELWKSLMIDVLGFDWFVAQGGDWGAMVTSRLAYSYPEHVAAIHLNLVAVSPHPSRRDNLSDAERAWMKEMAAWQRNELGYFHIQGTKPKTLGYGLVDSPAGLAAWIAEKFWTWTDHQPDGELTVSWDDLLDNIMVYWVSGSIESSTRMYYEEQHNPWRLRADELISVPTGVAHYPAEQVRPPREWAERAYNIARWTDMERGGHFPALEAPDGLVADIRSHFATFR